jgi:hypothetical protein
MITMTKSRSLLNNEQLNFLSNKMLDDIDSILDYFEVSKIKKTESKIYGACPIHGGTGERNPFNLFLTGDYYRGNWKCRSHNCHKVFQPSLLGLIRGLLSKKKLGWSAEGDKIISFQETINWCLSWTKEDLSSINVSADDIDKNKFIAQTKVSLVKQEKRKHYISRELVQSSLNIPAPQFIERGFSENTLKKYDIGLCKSKDPSKEMFDRVVVPIYDNDWMYLIGCTGRTIHKQCSKCKLYHHLDQECPRPEQSYKFVKWRHSTDFRAEKSLYNLFSAKKFIQECGTAILVESPGNVLRLEENGIHNSLATFGSYFSEYQQLLVTELGAFNLVVIPDKDDAGATYAKMIKDEYSRLFNIYIIDIPKNDVAELTTEEIDIHIKPTLKRLGVIK